MCLWNETARVFPAWKYFSSFWICQNVLNRNCCRLIAFEWIENVRFEFLLNWIVFNVHSSELLSSNIVSFVIELKKNRRKCAFFELMSPSGIIYNYFIISLRCTERIFIFHFLFLFIYLHQWICIALLE